MNATSIATPRRTLNRELFLHSDHLLRDGILKLLQGLAVRVVDMPSIDDELLLKLYATGKPLLFAEQNNGYLWQNFLKVL
jgi:hypothetical protein